VGNRGRRLDHIWATPSVAETCDKVSFHTDCRNWDRPSDHAPVMARFEM
jgi:exodeoxyribonuclease-3